MYTNAEAYIYIYIYILSSTDRLFRCITNFLCNKRREMLQAKIETRLTLILSDFLLQSHLYSSHKWGNFKNIHYRLDDYSIHEKSYCFSASVAVGKFLSRGLNPPVEHMYCHPQTLFRCITTLQAEIETQLTLRQSDILPLSFSA